MDQIEANIFYDFDTIFGIDPCMTEENISIGFEEGWENQNVASTPFELLCDIGPDTTQENISTGFEAEWESQNVVSTDPFELLKEYGTNMKRLQIEEKVTEQIPDPLRPCHGSRTAVSIMKLARSRLLDMKSENVDVLSILSKTCLGSQSGKLTSEEEIDVGMALQASAEQVAKKRFVSARKLLSWCQGSASKTGTPFQRVVYYFAEALQQKMDQEWGFITPYELAERKPLDVFQTMVTLLPARMSCEQQFFTSLVCQFTSIQSILENVATAKRIHLIDFGIKNGSPWTLLIQALAVRYECPVQLLKITAIGNSEKLMEGTGQRLRTFAETMNVPLSYNFVLCDLKEIKKEMFQIKPDETLAIYSSVCLWTVLAWPNELVKLIRVVKGLKPCLMVTHELDASLNSPDFLERFTQSLYHFSSFFDGLLVNLENQPYRKLTEEIYHRDRIRNTITCDGTKRYYRQVSASFWRSLFAKCGFVEARLSSSALTQANLLLHRSVNRSYHYLETDGKCLVAGCDGIPMEFVSTWKIRRYSLQNKSYSSILKLKPKVH